MSIQARDGSIVTLQRFVEKRVPTIDSSPLPRALRNVVGSTGRVLFPFGSDARSCENDPRRIPCIVPSTSRRCLHERMLETIRPSDSKAFCKMRSSFDASFIRRHALHLSLSPLRTSFSYRSFSFLECDGSTRIDEKGEEGVDRWKGVGSFKTK